MPHAFDTKVAEALTGIPGKNAKQQQYIVERDAGIQGAEPDTRKYSGRRKTVRRKNLRSSRKNK